MKTKLFISAICILLFQSCKFQFPNYLPNAASIGNNQFGANIKITQVSLQKLNGELIAIDSSLVIILDNETSQCVSIPINTIQGFKVQTAKPYNYKKAMIFFSLASLLHGWGLIVTLPVNLLTTGMIHTYSVEAYQLSNKDSKLSELKMYARFPQGIPQSISLDQIQPTELH